MPLSKNGRSLTLLMFLSHNTLISNKLLQCDFSQMNYCFIHIRTLAKILIFDLLIISHFIDANLAIFRK